MAKRMVIEYGLVSKLEYYTNVCMAQNLTDCESTTGDWLITNSIIQIKNDNFTQNLSDFEIDSASHMKLLKIKQIYLSMTII